MNLNALETRFAKLQVGTSTRLRTYEKLADLIANRVPVPQALQEMWRRESYNGRKPREALALALNEWRTAVVGGRFLAQGIANWASEREVMLIEASESKGSVEEGLRQTVNLLTAERQMKGAVIGAVAYPLVLVLATMALLYLFSVQVIPAFSAIVPVENWTGIAGQMAVMSFLVQNFAIPFVLSLAFIVFLAFWSLKRWTGPMRLRFEKIPPWSIYRLFIGGSFMMALAALVSAGVGLPEALRRVGRNATPYLRERITAILFHVEQGRNLGEAMDFAGFGFPDREIINDMSIYGSLGTLDEALTKVASRWMETGNRKIQAAASTARILAIVLIAGVIAWIALGLFNIQSLLTDMQNTVMP